MERGPSLEFGSGPREARRESAPDAAKRLEIFVEGALREAGREVEQLVKQSHETMASLRHDPEFRHVAAAELAAEVERSMESLGDFISSTTRKFESLLPWVLGVAFMGAAERAARAEVDGSFAARHEAAAQLAEKGITDKQRHEAYTAGLSELLYRTVTPLGYRSPVDVLLAMPENWDEYRVVWVDMGDNGPYLYAKHDYPDREDAWRMYLGLPQEHGTFTISEERPAQATEDTYYYAVPGWLESYAFLSDVRSHSWEKREPAEIVAKLVNAIEQTEHLERGQTLRDDELGIIEKAGDDSVVLADRRKGKDRGIAYGLLGQFTLSRGQDERGSYISYYDEWDLGPTMEGEEGLFGQPFEIYDRIYYNPETFEPLQ